MGDKSDIQWTDATWNPAVGCTPGAGGRSLDGREWNEYPKEMYAWLNSVK